MSLRVAIVGAAGRMGTAVMNAAYDLPGVVVSAAVVSPETDYDILGPQEIESSADLDADIADCDVVIDFSTPKGFLNALRCAADLGKPFVSGTTGLEEAHVVAIDSAAEKIPVLYAANFSVGINVLEHLVELATGAATGFDVEIFEAHHRHKVDAPSGTALFLGEAAARGRDRKLDDVARWERHGHVGERTDEEIGFQVARGGTIVGEHTVYLCGESERIELTHRASDRTIFAHGAIRAARWLHGRPAGRYAMRDVLFD